MHRDWLGDLEGTTVSLERQQLKRLTQGAWPQVTTTCALTTAELRRIAKQQGLQLSSAIDLSSAWNFNWTHIVEKPFAESRLLVQPW